MISERLAWLGVKISAEANAGKAFDISGVDSKVPVFVVPTNEELMIAKHTISVLGQRMGEA
jgi:acetate kinase